jgi:hypothetical protein
MQLIGRDGQRAGAVSRRAPGRVVDAPVPGGRHSRVQPVAGSSAPGRGTAGRVQRKDAHRFYEREGLKVCAYHFEIPVGKPAV